MGEAGLIAARVASTIAMMLAAGIPLYLICAKLRSDPVSRFIRLAGVAAAIALACSFWWALQSVAAMAALPVSQLDRAMVEAIMGATPLGNVLAVRVIALIIASIAAWYHRIVIAALAASLALATMGWTGHAGASEGGLGALHRASDVVHLLAASTWVGALCLFVSAIIWGRDTERLVRHLSGFATVGTLMVALLLATGIVNTLAIAGFPFDLTSPWTQLLSVKIALFIVMLGLAACNRWYLTPALGRDPHKNRSALIVSLSLETLAAVAILIVVGVIGTLSPGE